MCLWFLVLLLFFFNTLYLQLQEIYYSPLRSVTVQSSTPAKRLILTKLLQQPTGVSCFTIKIHVLMLLFVICVVKTSEFHTEK